MHSRSTKEYDNFIMYSKNYVETIFEITFFLIVKEIVYFEVEKLNSRKKRSLAKEYPFNENSW